MSMLLDALKKSEQQRRLGAQPDIHSAVDEPAGQASEPLGRWLPVLLVVVAVLVMAWFGWQQFAPPPATVSVDAPALAERQETSPAAAAPAARDDAGAAKPTPAAADGPRTPVETYSAPPPAATPGPAAATPVTPPPGAVPVRQAAQLAPSRAPANPAPSAQATPGEPYRPAVMSYWELPQGVRDGLPQFRVTVLVYADDPANRFLLVNGVRLKEKEELQSGVVLDEIRRDGAVFRARNYRFLVKG